MKTFLVYVFPWSECLVNVLCLDHNGWNNNNDNNNEGLLRNTASIFLKYGMSVEVVKRRVILYSHGVKVQRLLIGTNTEYTVVWNET